MKERPTEIIDSLDDPRLDPYRNLKSTNRTRWSNQFIAEGLLVVERLLASDFEVVSVVATRKMERQVVPLVPKDCPLFLLEHTLAEQLVGYTFHTGVLACGVRRASPTLESFLSGSPESALFAVCPNVNDPENIGAIIRLSAGFGLQGVILGPECADPFSRRVLRVSMGTAFTLPIRESSDLHVRFGALQRRIRHRAGRRRAGSCGRAVGTREPIAADGRSLWQRKAWTRLRLGRPLPAKTDNSDGPGSRLAQRRSRSGNIFSLPPATGASRIVDWNTPTKPAPQPTCRE